MNPRSAQNLFERRPVAAVGAFGFLRLAMAGVFPRPFEQVVADARQRDRGNDREVSALGLLGVGAGHLVPVFRVR
jgi:hypothetical protein